MLSRLAAVVAAAPEREAIVCGTSRWSYRELDRHSGLLAARLATRGVGRGDLVAVSLPRGPELISTLLAVLKTGAAYLPVDPGYPAERVRLMLDDSQASIMIDDADELASALLPPVARDGEEPMYVIYTSGSTGRPKGVVLPERAILNLIESLGQEPGLRAGERCLSLASLAFDMSVPEVWLPLAVGATVVMADEKEARDGAALRALIEREQIDFMQATPSTWRLLLDAGFRGRPGLRAVSGAEALPRELANEILQAGIALWNLYGPTETCVWSTLAQVRPGEQAVSIGAAIRETVTLVVDEELRSLPAGLPGELLIGGAGVALGYLNRPELTAERFVEIAGWPCRFYRTGDIVRERADGELEFLGRADRQVKLRGYRVELGEIETALGTLPELAEAAVTVAGEGESAHLRAYAVPKPGQLVELSGLRQLLSGQLPEYMLPNELVQLERLPRSPNGKIDYKSLPEPSRAGDVLALGSELEQRIGSIWCEVLKQDEIGRDDNFFEIGGQSLLALRLTSKLRREFQTDIPMRVIFERPTIGGLAAWLDGGKE